MRLTITLGILVLLAGNLACNQRATASPSPSPGMDEYQRAMGIVPCDTDSDCEKKNPAPKLPGCVSDGQDRGVDCTDTTGTFTKDGQPEYYCEALTKDGKRCSRHVSESGLLCKQHSRMVAAGKTVKTIDD